MRAAADERCCPLCGLLSQPAEEAVKDGLPVFLVDGPRQRNVHRTRFHAVLSITAHRNAVVSQDSVQPFLS